MSGSERSYTLEASSQLVQQGHFWGAEILDDLTSQLQKIKNEKSPDSCQEKSEALADGRKSE